MKIIKAFRFRTTGLGSKKGPKIALMLLLFIGLLSFLSFENADPAYLSLYSGRLDNFETHQGDLIRLVEEQETLTESNISLIKQGIVQCRRNLKAVDFWLRYLDAAGYKQINGPLPVEWETIVQGDEVESVKREGAGLILAELYLDERNPQKTELLRLLKHSQEALNNFSSDSIQNILNRPDHFFYANRLFLLNLATIYTSGFECPEPDRVISELEWMLLRTSEIYNAYNRSFPEMPVDQDYYPLFSSMQTFVGRQSKNPERFDHFTFIRDYVNPLFAMNQEMIRTYHVEPVFISDLTVNAECNSIFDKKLYTPQNRKGIYKDVKDPVLLEEIKATGKILFYDPILSGNGKRSCAGCHKPTEYFTDNTVATNLQYDGISSLPRNTPTLLNADFNYLLMLDGRHSTLQNQAKDVTTNPVEMGGEAEEILKAVLNCPDYKKAFKKYAQHTPGQSTITIDHIVSAITIYYTSFSDYDAPFDNAMNHTATISNESILGFNLFMSKAQCGTCHFAPQFNGVKPPYSGNEFEVLGVPEDTLYRQLSDDSGRYVINPAFETGFAFRTGTIRNAGFTAPYMHNGVFKTIDQVIEFYNTGGGAGHDLSVENQTLGADSLQLTIEEVTALKAFLKSLDEQIPFEAPPAGLPLSKNKIYNSRKPGGEY